eukprot:2627240-Pleurochrysis_carterae.AAC.1
MYVVIYIHSGFITPSPAHAATHARTCTAARRPTPAVPPRARPDRGHASAQASRHKRAQVVAPPRCSLDPDQVYPLCR